MSQPREFYNDTYLKTEDPSNDIENFLDIWESSVGKNGSWLPQSHPDACPFCDSRNIDATPEFQFYTDLAFNHYQCNDCGQQWLREYAFRACVRLDDEE